VSQCEFPSAVQENLWTITERSGDDVDPTIVVQIAEGCTASGDRRIRAGVRLFEVPVVIHGEQGRILVAQCTVVLFHVVEDVTLNDEGVFPTVIIKIFQTDSQPEDFPESAPKPASSSWALNEPWPSL